MSKTVTETCRTCGGCGYTESKTTEAPGVSYVDAHRGCRDCGGSGYKDIGRTYGKPTNTLKKGSGKEILTYDDRGVLLESRPKKPGWFS